MLGAYLLAHKALFVKLGMVVCLALLGPISCEPFGSPGAPPPTPLPTFTVAPLPTATAMPTATQAPTATATRVAPTATPKPQPTRTPTPRPTATPNTACIPGPGVTAVSATQIYTGNSSRRWVSLTFDSDGGSAGNAAAYLSILQAHNVRATWFLTGQFAQSNPALVRQIRDAGHDIGNHTFDHTNLISPPQTDAFICAELVKANQSISWVTDRTTRPYFRPPFGSYDYQVRTLAARLGYHTILWSIDPRDWDSANTAQDIQNSIFTSTSLKPGAIILMHVNSAHEAEALDGVITGLEERGYAIAPLSQLLG